MVPIVRIIKKSKPHFLHRSPVAPTTDEGQTMYYRHNTFMVAVEVWDNIFKIKYSEIRDTISALCYDYNHQDFDVTIEHLDMLRYLKFKKGCWLIIMDEDNLSHPRLPRMLRKQPVSHYMVYWNVYRSHLGTAIWDQRTLLTGSYAINCHKLTDYKRAFYHHTTTAQLSDQMRLLTENPLGLILIQPSSHGILSKIDLQTDVETQLRSLVNKYIHSTPEIPSPYKGIVNNIREIYQSL